MYGSRLKVNVQWDFRVLIDQVWMNDKPAARFCRGIHLIYDFR